LINPVRVPYFDRIWKAKLPLEAISNGKFLDAGCGGGIATEALAKLGYSITGLDMSKESVQVRTIGSI
jgi:2-polyprenyl-6-hydroxyphenyl methylase/3-demethylubiquinone-9 3-methyltransferase